MTWYAVDGLDGSGKSTAAAALEVILAERGRSVTVISHPDRGTFPGRMAARFLLKDGKPARMFAAVFLFIDILSSLKYRKRAETDDMVFIRYTLSAAYLPEKLVKPAYNLIVHLLPKADVSIYLDVDEEEALSRIKNRGGDMETYENYDDMCRVRRKMRSISDDWHIVSGDLDEEGVRLFLCNLVRSNVPD